MNKSTITTLRQAIKEIIRENVDTDKLKLKVQMNLAKKEFEDFEKSVEKIQTQYWKLSKAFNSGRANERTTEKYYAIKAQWENKIQPQLLKLRNQFDLARGAYNSSLSSEPTRTSSATPEEINVYGYDPSTHDSRRPRGGLGT